MSATHEDPIERRTFVARTIAVGAALLATPGIAAAAPSRTLRTDPPRPLAPTGAVARDPLFEQGVTELTELMRRGELTSRGLTERYLARIDAMDKRGAAINAIIELNPDALAIADRCDAERRAGNAAGPLHGIPVVVKDNIDSGDRMRTSAGSLALASTSAPHDAFIIERLRLAGAVLLGKTNMSEWANFRSTRSTSGWSGRGGLTRNPYVLDRNPCGSSSGTGAAIAADFATVGIGTETDGSIICPSSFCGLVGVKPTVGLWSRSGIIPISASQDTAGPMARSVADAAVLLGALVGVDGRDRATEQSRGRNASDYRGALHAGALKGARIGVARNLAGFNPDVDARFGEALRALADAGAIIVDPANLTTAGMFDAAEGVVLDYEFKAGLNAYLASRGAGTPVRTLAELIAWNEQEHGSEMPWFGQETFVRAQKAGPLTDRKYLDARAKCLLLARTQGVDATLARHRLDAIVLPSNQPAWTTDLLNGDHFVGGNSSFAAVAGYPSVTVPMGLVHELPVGISFIGGAWREARLLGFAFDFEQATKLRRSPRFLPTLG